MSCVDLAFCEPGTETVDEVVWRQSRGTNDQVVRLWRQSCVILLSEVTQNSPPQIEGCDREQYCSQSRWLGGIIRIQGVVTSYSADRLQLEETEAS